MDYWWTFRCPFHCGNLQGEIPCPPQTHHRFWEENTWGQHYSSSPPTHAQGCSVCLQLTSATDIAILRLARVRFGSGSGVLGPNLNLHSRFGSKQVPNTNINQMFMFKMFGSGSNNVRCQKNHFANFKYMLSSFTIATDSLSHLSRALSPQRTVKYR